MVGQHIRILKGGRWVHAIDCGDETVLHLAEEAPPPRVRRAYRPEFVAGAEAVEIVTHRERTFPAKEIVKRAYSRASDPVLAQMFQDSESFVEWCTTGRLGSARNVALEVPGVASAAAAPAAAVRANGEVAGAGKAAVRAAPKRKAAPAKKVAARMKAKPAVKVKARAPVKKVAARVKAKGAAKSGAAKAKAAAKKVAAKTRGAAKAKGAAKKGAAKRGAAGGGAKKAAKSGRR
jgi:hypothetical protein